MANFVELTDFNGNPVMVNINDISAIKQVIDPIFTAITTKRGLLIEVLQSHEEVCNLLTKNQEST